MKVIIRIAITLFILVIGIFPQFSELPLETCLFSVALILIAFSPEILRCIRNAKANKQMELEMKRREEEEQKEEEEQRRKLEEQIHLAGIRMDKANDFSETLTNNNAVIAIADEIARQIEVKVTQSIQTAITSKISGEICFYLDNSSIYLLNHTGNEVIRWTETDWKTEITLPKSRVIPKFERTTILSYKDYKISEITEDWKLDGLAMALCAIINQRLQIFSSKKIEYSKKEATFERESSPKIRVSWEGIQSEFIEL